MLPAHHYFEDIPLTKGRCVKCGNVLPPWGSCYTCVRIHREHKRFGRLVPVPKKEPPLVLSEPQKPPSYEWVNMMTPKQYLRRLRSEITKDELISDDHLVIRIVDYFLDKKYLSRTQFEELLLSRIDDSEPAKEESGAICNYILDGWEDQKEMV